MSMRAKKDLGIAIFLVFTLAFTLAYGMNPHSTFAYTCPGGTSSCKYDCSSPGESCLGVYLVPGMYDNGTDPLWVTEGHTITYGVGNIGAYDDIYFWISGPNGYTWAADPAVPSMSDSGTLQITAPYSGYYV
jgi:hypothetical protein